jgi:hypothetical protein
MSKNLKLLYLTGKTENFKSKIKFTKKTKFNSGKNKTFSEN